MPLIDLYRRAAKLVVSVLVLALVLAGCTKHSPAGSGNPDTTGTTTTPFDINSISDTYDSVAPFADYLKWGPYNVHDPSIKKFGNYYYCYSTDVGYGITVRPGIQIRRSKDLVQWEFVGWVFSSLPAAGVAYIQQKGGSPNNALWAPYVMQVGGTYRLYYA